MGPALSKSYTTPSKAQRHCKRDTEKKARDETQGECCCEILSTGNPPSNAIKNPQQLWLPAMGLCKNKPVNSQSWIGEGLMGPYSPNELLAVSTDYGQGTVTVSSYVPTEKLNRPQQIVPNPLSYI